jgi:hypothetical protein
MYYWVNQGKTYTEEKDGGYLWAPINNNTGRSFFHWDNMDKIVPGDVIFNYKKGVVLGYCIAESYSYKSIKPSEFSKDLGWESNGRMVDVKYHSVETPTSISDVYDDIEEYLPSEYSPLNVSIFKGETKIRANQGYLYELNDDLGDLLLKILGIRELNVKSFKGVERSDYTKPTVTERSGLVTSRVGQGKYRRELMYRWNNRCAVTGLTSTNLLIASHIVPWSESTDEERLDVNNGLLLSPIYDALFDNNLISFNNDGTIILSNSITKDEYAKIGVTGKESIRGLNESNIQYLQRQRKKLIK